MMQSMKGATQLLGSMNRQMNLPSLQRIAMEFERENDIMDQRQEMMDDAIDDVTGLEDEEEGEEVVNQILDEIGVDLNNAVSVRHAALGRTHWLVTVRVATNTDSQSRWGRRQPACRRLRYPRRASHRRLAVEGATTTCKPVWTHYVVRSDTGV